MRGVCLAEMLHVHLKGCCCQGNIIQLFVIVTKHVAWPNQCPALSVHRPMSTAFCRFIHMESMTPLIAEVSDVGLSVDYL